MCFVYFRICFFPPLIYRSFVGTCISISEFPHIDNYINACIFFKKSLQRFIKSLENPQRIIKSHVFYSVKFLFLDSYQISCVILSSVTRLLILGVDFSFVSFPLRVPKYGYFTIKPRLLSAYGKTLKSPLGGDISSSFYLSLQASGNPLQHSCLGNPMDGGPWCATFPRVTKGSGTTY